MTSAILWLISVALQTICVFGDQQNETLKRSYDIDKHIIFCQNRRFDSSPLSKITTIREIQTYGCEPTATLSYFDELQALNINASAVQIMSVMIDRNTPLPPGNYTEGLLINAFKIHSFKQYQYLLQNVQNFLKPLINLKTFSAYWLELPPLPETIDLVALTLSHSTIKDWGNCRYLETIKITHIAQIPKWSQNCKKLKSLTLYHIDDTDMVLKNMTSAWHSLRSLKINECALNIFPNEMLSSAINLHELDLSRNSIGGTSLQYIPVCNTLTTLDLCENGIIFVEDLNYLVPKLPGLREIRLGDTSITTSLCSSFNSFVPLQNWSIESILLRNVDFDLSCIHDLQFKNLKKIEMTNLNNTIIQFKLMHLPKTDTGALEVHLKELKLKFLFDETDFKTLKGKVSSTSWNRHNNLTVHTSKKYPISCDCKHGWLARALREFPNIISMPSLLCYHGKKQKHSIPLLDEPLELIECDKTKDKYCIYRKSWRDGTVVAECQKEVWNKEELPQNLHGLNVSGRNITTLRSKMPDSLQWLDLRRNAISRGNAEEAAALFAAGRRVWLADNPLLCDCDNRALLDAIQQHRDQVEDYDLLKCAGTDEAVKEISTAVLCQTAVFVTTISLGVCGVLAVIAGVTALLLWRYGEQLSMFLYSRGWLVSCLQKQDPDEKPYDAFLSFAHEDQEYVTETLLPGLENAPEQFRICVHYRDWPIGDWIPDQIMRSVQLSKRTLILLSRNFVASAWSTLELRYSLANSTEDPCAKVLVLIKDDVLDMNLDKELRKYLTFNTYLRCDDPWFWEKLRYVLPHKMKKNQSQNKDNVAEFKADVIDMRAPAVELAILSGINSFGLSNVEFESVDEPSRLGRNNN